MLMCTLSCRAPTRPLRWLAGWLLLQVLLSLTSTQQFFRTGAVLRDHVGKVNGCFSSSLPCVLDPSMAEAISTPETLS
ncbi:hypothetical protein M5689_001863 [Euphorbia peplus]|nr:hypothetical protein M5689_001863 [Euphorbia peplus]